VIGKLTGVIDSLNEDGLLLDVNGVGYVVHASSKTIGRLGAAGSNASILIETQVREDAITLFGFADHASATGSACSGACKASAARWHWRSCRL
jgi:Holliday junction DNA helicase RuvA